MVQHPRTRQELDNLPEVHRMVTGVRPSSDVVKLVTERINALDEDGNTALHRALAQPDERLHDGTRTAIWLVENGIDLDVRNHDGQTALDLARERHASLSEADRPDDAMRMAIQVNYLNALAAEPGDWLPTDGTKDMLVGTRGLLSDLVRTGDVTGVREVWPAVEAARQAGLTQGMAVQGFANEIRGLFDEARTPEMITVLAQDCGLSPNHDVGFGATFPLQNAVAQREYERVESLLANGAHPDAVPMLGDRDQRSLGLAIKAKDERLVGMLCDAGARMEGGHSDTPPLVLAIQANCPASIVQNLLQHGANPNEHKMSTNPTVENHPCPLHLVTDRHDPAITDVLIDYGAKSDGLYNGQTAQFLAACRGDLDVVDRMVARGGDPAGVDVVDKLGNTPLAYQLGSNDPTVANRLLEHGANARVAMESEQRRRVGEFVSSTSTIEHVKTWEEKVLRQAADEAMQAVALEQGPDAEPAKPRQRRRL